MKRKMPPILRRIATARRDQARIARLEQRPAGARVRPRDGGRRRVGDVVLLRRVAVGAEEEEPGAGVVEEGGRFDQALVGGAVVVEDCGRGAHEGGAGGGEALEAEGGWLDGFDWGFHLLAGGGGRAGCKGGVVTGVAADAAVADRVAVDFPGDPALAVVVEDGGVDGAALVEGADQCFVSGWGVRAGNGVGCGDADAVQGGVLGCGCTVVHHEGAVVLWKCD